MFTTVVSIYKKRVNRWEQPKYLWMDKWISTVWYIHSREYCSVFKRKEILMCATMWKVT